jgi:hypothetical protein
MVAPDGVWNVDAGTLVVNCVISNETSLALTDARMPSELTQYSPLASALVVLEKVKHERLNPFTVLVEVATDTPCAAAAAWNTENSVTQYLLVKNSNASANTAVSDSGNDVQFHEPETFEHSYAFVPLLTNSLAPESVFKAKLSGGAAANSRVFVVLPVVS